ncbi:MAG: HDOD domain-containing protein [Zoogloeaceae bacterium]|nr:HDOD domain-containing protein [Zoogloeaceae bacterium]
MLPVLNSTTRLMRFAPTAQSIQTGLGLVNANNIDWDALAEIAVKDAALAHAIFTALPLQHDEDLPDLASVIARRLKRIGGDLLQAWLLQANRPHSPSTIDHEISTASLFVAECAHHLALETHYRRPRDAYLAGLWHELGRLWLAAEVPAYHDLSAGLGNGDELFAAEQQRYGQNHAALGADLVRQCGAPPPIQDAIALHHALEEQIRTAHPLVRLVWCAVRLGAEDPGPALAAISRVTGLAETALLSLRTDVAYLAGTPNISADTLHSHAFPLAPSIDTLEPSVSGPDDPHERGQPIRAPASATVTLHLHSLALQGLVRKAFADGPIAEMGSRLEAGCRLLFGRGMPLAVSVETSGLLQAIPMKGPDAVVRNFDELQMALDDEASVLALAARTGATTSQFPGGDFPGRSTADWQITRWFGSRGLLCLPWSSPQGQFVAVFAIDAPLERTAEDQSLMVAVVGAAAGQVYAHAAQVAQDTALRASVEGRFREHIRRVVHEVNNPLTVIRSYLDLMGQKLDGPLRSADEFTVVNKELDRVGKLLQTMARGPVEVAEAPRCHVAELLLEMRTLYGEPWFGRRQIELDLRVASGLPPTHIPPSVLKQVLINLLRNASEALGKGHKLAVSTAGVVIADGLPSLEIRLIDNGPGIASDRLPEIFKPHRSQKPGHQGVGLSICRELLHQWHGSILCRSQPGSGTSFQIFIPLDPVT